MIFPQNPGASQVTIAFNTPSHGHPRLDHLKPGLQESPRRQLGCQMGTPGLRGLSAPVSRSTVAKKITQIWRHQRWVFFRTGWIYIYIYIICMYVYICIYIYIYILYRIIYSIDFHWTWGFWNKHRTKIRVSTHQTRKTTPKKFRTLAPFAWVMYHNWMGKGDGLDCFWYNFPCLV